MIKLTIYRGDFRNSQDSPNESLFEGILTDLKIPEEKWDSINEVTISMIDDDNIEIN